MRVVTVANLSGGIQSTTIFHLMKTGKLPLADCGIFADTGWDRPSTYRTIESIKEYAKDMDFPFYTVQSNLPHLIREQALNEDHAHIPFFARYKGERKTRKRKKQCTTKYKIDPIRSFLRKEFGKKSTFTQWLGISLDEIQRMRTSDVKYITFKYPLVEMRWTRKHCIEFLHSLDVPIPERSACIGCPLHSKKTWQALTPAERKSAIHFDEQIRHLNSGKQVVIGKSKGQKEHQPELFDDVSAPVVKTIEAEYLHYSGRPLSEVFIDDSTPDLEYDPDNDDCGANCFV